MWRSYAAVAVSVLCCTTVLSLTETEQEIIENEKVNDFLKRPNSVSFAQTAKCDTVEGNLSGTSTCYPCKHPVMKRHMDKRSKITNLTLINGNCDRMIVCCVVLNDLTSRSSSLSCGKKRFDLPLKEDPNAVLSQEYPWRAYVVDKKIKKIICAATYINEIKNLFVAPKSCITSNDMHQYSITFYRSMSPTSVVKTVIGNNDTPTTRDLVLLEIQSKENIPRWAKAVCLPTKDDILQPSSGCHSVTEDEKSVNPIISQRSLCGPNLARDKLCATALTVDGQPYRGEGLVYQVRQPINKRLNYYLVGVTLDTGASENTNLHKYTGRADVYANVAQYDWIFKRIDG